MTLDDFKDLLGRWGWYCSKRGATSLGYAMSSYAERIGKDGRDRDHIEVDPDVLRFDEWINGNALDPEVRWVLILKYVVAGPDKSKHAGMSQAAYYARLDLARNVALREWNAHTNSAEAEPQTEESR